MRRILFCVLLGIMTSAPLLTAQNPVSALANLADLNQRGQFPQLIEAANSFIANDKLSAADRGMALIYLGYAYLQSGEFTNAMATYEKALAILARDGQHPGDYAATLAALGTVYSEIGRFDTAKRLLIRSTHLFNSQNDHLGAAMIWSDLAIIATEQHARRDAHKYMAHAVDESQLANNMSPGEFAGLATAQGRLAELDGDPRTAIQDFQHALDLWKQSNQDQQQRTAWLYVLLGDAYLKAGDIANARESTTRGMALLEAASGRQTPRYLLAELVYSKVLDASGSHDEASRVRKEAQSSLNTGTDRRRAQSEISVSALR